MHVTNVLRTAIFAALVLGLANFARAATWQNPTDANDVDNSGVIAHRDAVIDVNWLNSLGSGPVPSMGSPPPYYDVTGDNLISPADVVHLVNQLIANAGSPAPPSAGVPTVPGGPQVAIQLVVTDSGGTPISVATPGQALQLQVFAQDLRVSPPLAGVFSASTDIAYSGVALGPGSAVYEPSWFADSPADSSAPGLLADLNATTTSLTPATTAPELLFSLPLVAGAAGLATFTSSAASASELHDFLLFGNDDPIPLNQVVFGTATLTIVPEPASWTLAAASALALTVVARRRKGFSRLVSRM